VGFEIAVAGAALLPVSEACCAPCGLGKDWWRGELSCPNGACVRIEVEAARDGCPQVASAATSPARAVHRPPAFAARCLRLIAQVRQAALKLCVRPQREQGYRTAVGVVCGIGDELVVGSELRRRVQRVAVVGLKNFLIAWMGSFPSPTRMPSPPALRKASWTSEMALMMVKCRVTDYSSRGARIALASAFALPDAFELRGIGRHCHARLVHRSVGGAGVEFV
jgi:hypothetical protein